MKRFYYILFFFPIFAMSQSIDENFIKNTIYKGAGGTLPSTKITYFQSLGRPMREILFGQSTTGKDIVTHFEYDLFGRQQKEFLPYANTTSTLNLDGNGIFQLNQFYNNPTYENTLNPFSEKEFEPSPLNRVIRQASPGNPWAIGSGREIKLDYKTNTASDVIYFKITTTWDATKRLYDISIDNLGNYEASQLYKTITKDENWTAGNNNTTQEFKNKEGQVILKRTYNAGNAHDTYYVYDQYGNLTYVLPPLAEAGITTATLNGLCYQYKYDYRNRLAAKKLPGKQWEFIVYDKLDRPIATGPAFSPWGDSANGVLITDYDVFGRVTQTGWKNLVITEASRSGWQNDIAGGTNPFALTTNDVLTKNYYDNYTYPGAPALPTALPDSTYPIAQNVKGMATGSWVRVLTTPTDLNAETSYTFYDDKYRPVRTYTKNHLGGFTQTDSNLDFIGKTNYTITTHKRMSTDAVLTVKDNFTYTPQDRLLLHTQQINALPLQLIASNTYDELGQLLSKNVGGTDVSGATGLQKVDYNYNIRGWLKSINDTANLQQSVTVPKDLFAFKLSYNDPATATALYNGNISETFWKTNSDNTLRKYNYAYDNLNRLTDAVYAKPDVASSQKNYNESLTYDKNGNILRLSRTGDRDSDGMMPENEIDNLSYTYHPDNKNQLMKVFDKSNSPQGFVDDSDGISDTTDDYWYDANGNMKADINKGITGIAYNHLNLPTQIFFRSNKIEYIYNAIGQKLEKKVTQGATVTTTQYLGGYQYKNNLLQFFPHAEGYVNKTGLVYSYIYNYTDHLGNIRLSYTKDLSTGLLKILEENHYYPFGLKHTNYNSDKLALVEEGGGVKPKPVPVSPYKYKYNGKELQDELGLNVYDYGWRNYMPDIGRWTQMDPLLNDLKFAFNDSDVDEDDDEEVYEALITKLDTGGGVYNTNNLNPYGYGYNNPVSFDDPDGRCPICPVIAVAIMLLASEPAMAPTKDRRDGQKMADSKVDKLEFMSNAIGFGEAKTGFSAAMGVVKKEVKDKVKDQVLKTAENQSSNAARREVMRKEGIPTSQQPKSQSKNASGREYTYETSKKGGGTEAKSVQQQTKDRSHEGQPHWEAGKVKTNTDGTTRTNDYGRPKIVNQKSKVDYID